MPQASSPARGALKLRCTHTGMAHKRPQMRNMCHMRQAEALAAKSAQAAEAAQAARDREAREAALAREAAHAAAMDACLRRSEAARVLPYPMKTLHNPALPHPTLPYPRLPGYWPSRVLCSVGPR